MVDIPKHLANGSGGNLSSDIKNVFTLLRNRKTMVFAYGFMFTFVCFTAFLAFSPSSTSSSPWFKDIFSSSASSITTTTNTATGSGFRSQVSSIYSYFFPNASQPMSQTNPNAIRSDTNTTSVGHETPSEEPKLDQTVNVPSLPPISTPLPSPSPSSSSSPVAKNETAVNRIPTPAPTASPASSSSPVPKNERAVKRGPEQNDGTIPTSTTSSSNSTNQAPKSDNSKKINQAPPKSDNSRKISKGLLKSLMHCNIFDGGWVIDDSYPLYAPGSCPHIDEPFNCFLNGRPDNDFQKLRWKPKDCDIPRLNGEDMLELLRGKRLVFVGDSLNRNMWESLICTLRNSVKDKSKVFEASGRREFRTEGSYSFLFGDYNCSVEFFRSPFLVQEWEMPDMNGTTKETLRLDLVERKSFNYKDADILVFNTGHWWTHEKTAKGKGYYQVGNHVYGTLNVDEAFHRALSTWAKWVDANVNPSKTHVSFRGYSASHFR